MPWDMPGFEAHRAALNGASLGKSCIRYANPDRIDFDLVGAMLDHAYRANGGDA